MSNIFEKKLPDYGDTTTGVSVEEIKDSDWKGRIDEESNLSVLSGAVYPDKENNGKPFTTCDLRVIANVKLTKRGKVKKVMIMIPFDTNEMQKVIDTAREQDRFGYEIYEEKVA
jgi:hypothetical protein